jgi:hypothetical protein
MISLLRQNHQSISLVGILYVGLALSILAPIASDNVLPAVPDIANHVAAIVQARMAIEESQFPLRVAPWQHDGARYPLFQFYSPTPYSVAALLYKWITPRNPFVAYKICIWFSLVLGALYIFRISLYLVRCKYAAALAGAMYMFAPYYLINIHARGAFTEAIGQGLLPVVIFYSLRAYSTQKLSWILKAGLSWYLLITTHVITFVYASVFLSVFFGLLSVKQRGGRRLFASALAFSIGITLALYFIAPMAEADYLQIRSSIENPYETRWLTPLAALVSPVSIPPEPQPGKPTTPHLHPAIGWPMLLSGLAVVAGLGNYVSLAFRAKAICIVLLALFALGVLMTWSAVNVWVFLPDVLFITQFTYRILAQVMWTGALLGSFGVYSILDRDVRFKHLVLGLLLLGMSSSSYLPSLESSPLQVADLVKAPDLGYGQNAYLPTRLGVDRLHNCPFVYQDGWLMEEECITGIDKVGLASASVELQGEVPSNYLASTTLSLVVNGGEIASRHLSAGYFTWRIPLENVKVSNDGKYRIGFKAKGSFVAAQLDTKSKDSRSLAVRVSHLIITDSYDSSTRINVPRTACYQQKATTVCKVSSLERALAQLPVLFYPQFLDVTINDTPVGYTKLRDRQQLFVGVGVDKGDAIVRIRFEGLAWSNWLSAIMWVMLCSIVILRALLRWKAKDALSVKSLVQERC